MPDGKYQVRYHPLFHTDVVSAANWYDRHKVGLGFDFLECVEVATLKLAEDPYRRSSVDYGLRYWPISRFPFVVFYDVRELEILMADRGVAFRVAHPKSSRFSSRVGVCQKTFFH